jgi:NAD(P)-dependent dehydrogenase (short-subunit alcohol dehydrogenase family)
VSEVAWVTGAASGMGAACGRRFAAEGAAVGCVDVSGRVREVAAEIEAGGGTAHAVVCDVSDPAAVEAAAAELEDALGPASVAVVAAGVKTTPGPIAELDPAEWDRVVAVNLTGVYLTLRATIPRIRRAGGGSIVVIASVAGLEAGPNYAAYDSAKHGAVGLMKAAANELAADGIRVNAICPGWVDTPMLDAELADMGLNRKDGIPKLAKDHLIKRLVEPGEIAEAVFWLCSPRAAMITGVALPVDGGLLAGVFNK